MPSVNPVLKIQNAVPKQAGGWHSLLYTLKLMMRHGPTRFYKAMAAKNTCKTCALGMGGQKGGMRNELGHWPEVCKKSMQAMGADLAPAFSNTMIEHTPIEQLRKLSSRELEGLGRISKPLILREGKSHYETISWDNALDEISKKFKNTLPQKTFFYFSGRSSNEAGFLLQLFARCYGTNHVNNCSFYCHQASGVGLTQSLGTSTATLTLEDVEKTDLFFLIGGNPSSNHPRLLTSLREIRRRGGKVISINPVVEPGLKRFAIPSKPFSLLFGSKISDVYLQPTIGGDIALLMGIAKSILENNAQDSNFIASFTNGFDEYENKVKTTSWAEITKGSGVSQKEIEHVAKLYSNSKRTVFSWTMGITHHTHGVQNVQSIVNLALLRGMIGKKGAGLLPIRGHSNVQGMGTVGVTPELKKSIHNHLTRIGITPPSHQGLDTMGCMHGAYKQELNIGFCLGGNLYGSNPDSNYAKKALSNLDLLIYLNTTLNTGHTHGTAKNTIILPVFARDEEPEPTTQESMFNFVRLSEGGNPRIKSARSEIAVISEIANRVLSTSSPIDWNELKNARHIRAHLSKAILGLKELETIDETKKEFTIPKRILHNPGFNTDDKKAKFFAHPIPKRDVSDEFPFLMMSVRSEGQFNTVVYEEEDVYRGIERRDVVLMNPLDMKVLELRHNERVTVFSETGRLGPVFVKTYPIKEGNVLMYYPEANAIISKNLDPQSKTPAYKAVPVNILKG